MLTTKVAITIEQDLLAELDQLVAERVFPNRSKAVQQAIQEKLARMRRTRLAAECAKLDPQLEQAVAEQGMAWELETWPDY
jgi:metal-responsive CopG/Arc/MetJ family transcriptional regulator